MPYKPKKPCRQTGCPNLTHKTYCERHEKLNRRESAYERGYTNKWQKQSKLYLKQNPLCVQCQSKGKLVMATVVDHITPHRGNAQLMWSKSNWQSLCKRCHDKKTGTHDSTPIYKY
ncbi:MAG: HNH endonuclease [Firmicutes bacterium]|nr:HNH endonuclease [Bacillota bacterium]